MNISVNELTKECISAIEGNFDDSDQLKITVNDDEHFVLVRLEYYNYLRECELQLARFQAKEDIKTGDFVIENVDDHIKRITDDHL